jgi:hypothetical protein
MFRTTLLVGTATMLMGFQSPPGPDGPPIPSPTMTPMTAPSPTPTPSPSTTPTPTPTPSVSPLPLPTDQSPEAKDAGGSGETQGDDQPPKHAAV